MTDRTAASHHEFARQRALDSYRIVDSLPEGAYDDIVRVAAAVCGTPIALVSLIDRDRQWFKAKLGADDRETPRNVAVCDYAIRSPDALMEIPDLTQDARFAGFPTVVGDLGARFYAGAPLVTPQGAAIGTVCVVGHEPRSLTDAQRDALGALSRITMALLEGRSREHQLERATLLQAAAPAAAADAADGYTVVILELQDFAGVVERIGERAAEKSLHQVDLELEQCLRRERGDTLNRVTGSPEFIAVLQGTDAADTLQRLRDVVARHDHRNGGRLLVGAASADSAGEPTQYVFLRADEALTICKDQHRANASV